METLHEVNSSFITLTLLPAFMQMKKKGVDRFLFKVVRTSRLDFIKKYFKYFNNSDRKSWSTLRDVERENSNGRNHKPVVLGFKKQTSCCVSHTQSAALNQSLELLYSQADETVKRSQFWKPGSSSKRSFYWISAVLTSCRKNTFHSHKIYIDYLIKQKKRW